MVKGNGVKLKYLLPRSHLMEDEYGLAFKENTRQVISVPNDRPMTPSLRTKAPLVRTPLLDSPMTTLAP